MSGILAEKHVGHLHGFDSAGKAERPSSRLEVFSIVSFHIMIALMVTITNKQALNTLPMPVSLLLGQSLLSIFFAKAGSAMDLWNVGKTDCATLWSIAPLLCIRVLAALSKMYCLSEVEASFYQVARGLLLPFTLLLSVCFLPNAKPSRLCLGACFVVMLGFGIGIFNNEVGSAPRSGIAWGIWSSLTTAIETIMMKRYVSSLNFGVMQLVYTSAVAMIVPLGILLTTTDEARHLRLLSDQTDPVLYVFGAQAYVAGVFNFLLCIAAFLQIKVTSPTSHMVSTAARGVLQGVAALLLLHGETMSGPKLISIGVILLGSILYTYGKDLEMEKIHDETKNGLNLPIFESRPLTTNPEQ